MHTLVEFYLSAGLTGALLAALFLPITQDTLIRVAASCSLGLALQQLVKATWLLRSRVFELRASGELLRYRLMPWFAARFCGLAAIGVTIPPLRHDRWVLVVCLAVSIGLELMGRYLFFVSVVPKNMAASYLKERRAA
jgi:DMSO reductase anchor subunit